MAAKTKKNGFTLIEVITAVGLLAIIIAFSSVIFNFGIDAYRISAANAEIMQKARALTEQLNSDLQGLRKDAPIAIWFRQDSTAEPNRYDQIMFFADGDFTSMQLYRTTNGSLVLMDDVDQSNAEPIYGNLARIHYGQTEDAKKPWDIDDPSKRSFGRRCHILTDNPIFLNGSAYDWLGSDVSNFGTKILEKVPLAPHYFKNDAYEHDTMPLNEWKKIDQTNFADLNEVAFEHRPLFDTNDPDTYHNLLCEGISSFAIQWAYWDENSSSDEELRWFPSDDPDNGGPDLNDSQFDLNKGASSQDTFGVVFNISIGTGFGKWHNVGHLQYASLEDFPDDFFPDALKFTFTVYDSKKVIKDGRTFTHIVYLKD